MGKLTGFIEIARAPAHRRPIAERLRDWREVEIGETPEVTRGQAARCMDCGVPFCMSGCPLGNATPEFADAVWRDRWHDAYRALAATNDFPELTGRLCPAPCEAACVLGIDGAPVTIEALERAVIERAFAAGWVVPQPPRARTGKRVAVIGSGPAGLAAASQLNRAGHAVTVFEAAPRAGGLLRYGIPDFKLDKAVVDRRLALLAAEGIELRCGVVAGVDPSWDVLRAGHDAIVLAVGAARPRELDVPGRELAGVVLAMDYLCDQNRVVGGEQAAARFDVRGKRVIILGGGDTGSDCLGTALRQGAASVQQIELVAAPPDVRTPDNPWPAWPIVMRTSSSQEEGGGRAFGVRTLALAGAGKLEALRVVDVGRDLVPVAGSERQIEADVLVLALGFTGVALDLPVDRDARGNIAAADYRTSLQNVYACGDAKRGASLIVWAIAEGRASAAAVNAALSD